MHVFQNAMETILLRVLSPNRPRTHVSIVDTTNARDRFAISEDNLDEFTKPRTQD